MLRRNAVKRAAFRIDVIDEYLLNEALLPIAVIAVGVFLITYRIFAVFRKIKDGGAIDRKDISHIIVDYLFYYLGWFAIISLIISRLFYF